MTPTRRRRTTMRLLSQITVLLAATTRCDKAPTSSSIGDSLSPAFTITSTLVAKPGGPYSGKEGSPVNVDGSHSTGPAGTTLTYDWDWGDGSAHGTNAKTSHTYADDGTYTITLVVMSTPTDSSAPASTKATIANAAPVITTLPAPTPTPRIGSPVTVTGTFTDAGVLDTHNAKIDWGDGTTPSAATVSESGGAGSASGTHTYAVTGARTIKLSVTDNNGATASKNVKVNVGKANRPPTASAGGPYVGVEGSAVSVKGSATDPDGDALTYDWDWGDGTAHGSGQSATHAYVDNGTYTVTLIVTDPYGAASTPATTTATIANAAPVVGPLSGPASPPPPGTTIAVTGPFTDAGTADTHTATFDWGDGTKTDGTVTESGGSGSASGSHSYAVSGSFVVTLTVKDKDGGVGSNTLTIGAVNHPPVASAGGPYTGTAGVAIQFDGSRSSDPDGDPISYSWTWGDGTPNGSGVGPTHTYALVGSYTVSLVVTDSHGAASTPSTTTATVNSGNARPPVITGLSGPTSSFPQDYPVTVSATFKDSNTAALHTASIDWGDGSVTSPARLSETSGAGTTGGSHTYAASGSYNVRITVTNDGGAAGAGTIALSATALVDAKVLVGSGDIATCSASGDEQTSTLLDRVAGWVIAIGDLAYPNGTTDDFNNCYDPAASWGRHKDRTHPALGNHEYYGTADAAGYFGYWGSQGGAYGQGYYSYDLGTWHVIVVNSGISMAAGSAQDTWLRNDLATHSQACTLLYFHHPLFSSGPTGGTSAPKPVWDAAYQYKADVIVNGHEHVYERFAPQDPNGNADPVNGIREFIVGTGGDGNSNISGTTPLPNSESRYAATFGVLKLTLDVGSYSWQYIPTSGSFSDNGTAACH